jgi:guanyl-specific ribonuclease Sa
MRAVARPKRNEKTKGKGKMKLSKTILAVLGTGLLSCALFSPQAEAVLISGNINFAGSVSVGPSRENVDFAAVPPDGQNTVSMVAAGSVWQYVDDGSDQGISRKYGRTEARKMRGGA